MPVSRELLYEEVWKDPMTTVARRYRVSSSFLARICDRLNVPRPPRGYWAKQAFGKAPDRPALPPARPEDEQAWVRGERWKHTPVPLPLTVQEPAAQAPPPESRTRCPARHPLIAEAPPFFESARVLESGFLKPSKRVMVDVVSSREDLEHALNVANGFFRALESRGHRVTIAPRDQNLRRIAIDPKDRDLYRPPWSPDRPTVVFMGLVAFGITVYELTEEAAVEWHDGKYVRTSSLPPRPRPRHASAYMYDTKQKRQIPSGRVCVRAFSPYDLASWKQEWRETRSGSLTAQYKGIVEKLELEAPALVEMLREGKRQADMYQREWEEKIRRLEQERADEKRQEAIKRSRERLFEIIDAWGVAKRMEGFFEDIERRAATLGDEERDLLLRRARDARELLGGIDALKRFQAWSPP
jgi:hypothetical protein